MGSQSGNRKSRAASPPPRKPTIQTASVKRFNVTGCVKVFGIAAWFVSLVAAVSLAFFGEKVGLDADMCGMLTKAAVAGWAITIFTTVAKFSIACVRGRKAGCPKDTKEKAK